MSEPNACAFCEGSFKWSDWSPFCSAGCEFGASLAIERAEGAAAERAAIAHTLRARAETLRDRKALGAAEEVEALAFYVEQRGEVASEQI